MRDIRHLKAIDSHTHINHGMKWDSPNEGNCYTAYLDKLLKMKEATNTEYLFASTFASLLSTEITEQENEYMFQLAKEMDCIYQWVVIEPRNENTYKQAEKMLESGKCVGIKIHPLSHKFSLDEYGDRIFSLASAYKAIVQIHPEKEASYILPFADKYSDVTFIMAHLGDEHYVDAIEYAKNGNVYVDTSGMASSKNMIVEYAVGRVGSERILFGTDTYAPGFQRGRIEYALISEQDKENILRNNAQRLFGQKLQ